MGAAIGNGILLGSGAYRDVRAYDDGAVIKTTRAIWDEHEMNANEVARWLLVKDTQHARYFFGLRCWADDYSWIVQERAVKTLEEAIMDREIFEHDPRVKECRQIARYYGVKDLHVENLGLRADGSVAVLDYATGTDVELVRRRLRGENDDEVLAA